MNIKNILTEKLPANHLLLSIDLSTVSEFEWEIIKILDIERHLSKRLISENIHYKLV